MRILRASFTFDNLALSRGRAVMVARHALHRLRVDLQDLRAGGQFGTPVEVRLPEPAATDDRVMTDRIVGSVRDRLRENTRG
jgi:hypothetical protein